jgi:hypothetical protein
MATASIEELQNRISILEAQVAQLLARNKEPVEKDWRKTLGMFTGKEGMDEILEETQRIREADRHAARTDPHYFDQDDPK